MNEEEQQHKMIFTRRGAWLGLIAYIILTIIVAMVFA